MQRSDPDQVAQFNALVEAFNAELDRIKSGKDQERLTSGRLTEDFFHKNG